MSRIFFLDPNVEIVHGTVGGLDLEGFKILRGLSQMSQAFETEDEEVWDEHRIEPDRISSHAGDRVVVLQREYQRSPRAAVPETVIDTATLHLDPAVTGASFEYRSHEATPSKPPGFRSRRCRRRTWRSCGAIYEAWNAARRGRPS